VKIKSHSLEIDLYLNIGEKFIKNWINSKNHPLVTHHMLINHWRNFQKCLEGQQRSIGQELGSQIMIS
jgi:hypothetical protein